MIFVARKRKYFIVPAGSDRAVIRTGLRQALKKKKDIERCKGVKAHIFVSDKKLEDAGK